MKNEPKDRIQSYAKKYGILQDFTRLFFFELKNEIFVTSAEENRQAQVSAAAARTSAEAVPPDAAEQAGGLVSTPQGPANLQGILPGARSIS